jgi:hypothetical protein
MMSPYFRNLLKSIGHDYMAPDARVYNTKQYLDGGRVGFENGKKVKTPEQYKKNLLTKKRYYEKQKTNPNFRQDKTLKDKTNLLKNAERTFAENPGLKEAHINNLYRKENGKFVRRYEPLKPFAEVFADFGIKPSMAKEFSSIIRKELKADGSLGRAKGSDVQDKRNTNIKEGKANAGPTVKPIQKNLETQISKYNKMYSDLLAKDSKKLVKTIRQKDNLMDQLKSVFKDGEVKKEKISDDEIKKLVKNGLYSEDHKTQVQTGSKNIEYNVNKSFVTKKTNSSVLAPMTMWLNKNYKLIDGEVKDPKIKNIKNWLTKNNINTKIEGLSSYFGDDSLKKISAEEAYKKQLNFLETSSSKLGKGLNLLGKGINYLDVPIAGGAFTGYSVGELAADIAQGKKTDVAPIDITLPGMFADIATKGAGLYNSSKTGLGSQILRAGMSPELASKVLPKIAKGSVFATAPLEAAIAGYNARKDLVEARKNSSVFEPTVDTVMGKAPKSYYNEMMSNIPAEGKSKTFNNPLTDEPMFTLPEVGIEEFSAASGGIAGILKK